MLKVMEPSILESLVEELRMENGIDLWETEDEALRRNFAWLS